MNLILENAPLFTLVGVLVTALISVWIAVRSHIEQGNRQHADHEHAKAMAVMNARLEGALNAEDRNLKYRLETQIENASDLYLSILEFQDAIWAYWGPFAQEQRPEILGSKITSDRADDAYLKAQSLRVQYFKCHLKFSKEQMMHTKSLVDLIGDAKLNFNFQGKPALVDFWINTQFEKSYAPFTKALESLDKLRTEFK